MWTSLQLDVLPLSSPEAATLPERHNQLRVHSVAITHAGNNKLVQRLFKHLCLSVHMWLVPVF